MLLHGLARSDGSMEKMADRLKEEGFAVINHDYPSTEYPIEELSRKVIPEAAGECPEKSKIHFVTHSLGGILVRYYLEYHELDNLGRVVMLGPPNKGSQVVDAMAEMPGFKLLNGPAGLAYDRWPRRPLFVLALFLGAASTAIYGSRGANGVVSANFSHTNNDHYRQLEDDRVDLSDPAMLVRVTHRPATTPTMPSGTASRITNG